MEATTKNRGFRDLIGKLVLGFCLFSIIFSLLSLVTILSDAFIDGIRWFDLQFITSYPSRFPEKAGILAALAGSIWIVTLTTLFSFPLGVSAALYLEEFASKNRLNELINLNIANLAGVPSIVYGILGIGLFVDLLNLGRSVLAGALTMTLLILPVIIIASREAIRSVPQEYRDGAYALGATRWEVTRDIVFRQAFPGMLTGTILAISRAIGEAAPMLAIAALVYIRFIPSGPLDRFTVMPIQIFNWISLPNPEFQGLAAAGILVLLTVLLSMNMVAVYIRNKYQVKK
jgi:phosphate transport system permease protein